MLIISQTQIRNSKPPPSIKTPRKYTPEIKIRAIRNILVKENRKLILLRRTRRVRKSTFGPDKYIEYYDPGTYDGGEYRLLDNELDANST